MKTVAGGSRTPEYKAWVGIKRRCFVPHEPAFKDYGERGITMAREWRHDFNSFLEHVGPRPTPKHTIDRVNNDGNYEPVNVRWATRAEQARNRRGNRPITYNGQTKTIAEWAAEIGIGRTNLARRIDRYHWPIELALKTSRRSIRYNVNRGPHKLSDEQVREIRSNPGRHDSYWAGRFKVSAFTIKRVRLGICYKDIKPVPVTEVA